MSTFVVRVGGQDARAKLPQGSQGWSRPGARLLAAEHRFIASLLWPCRYCTEGKRTFSSRLILEKHIQVRHGIKVTDQTKSQEVVIARIGTGTAQVRGLCGLSGCS